MKKKILAVLLAVSMLLACSASVFADTNPGWTSFQNGNDNNGVIDGTAPATSGTPTISLNDDLQGAQWSGIDVPLVIDSNNNAYALYSASTTTRMAKINLATGTFANNWGGDAGIEIGPTSAFQLSTPLIEGNDLYVAAVDFASVTTDPDFQNYNFSGNPIDWDVNSVSGSTFAKISQLSGTTTYALKAYNIGTVDVSQDVFLNGTGSLRIEGTIVGVNCATNSTLQILIDNTVVDTYDLTVQEGQIISKNLTNSVTAGTHTVTLRFTITNDGKNVYAYSTYFNLFQEDSMIKVINNINSNGQPAPTQLGTSIFPGQINTPIKSDGTNLYFGTYNSTYGGKYYQVNKTTGSVSTFTPDNTDQFYWAGAAIVGDYIVFGSDNGTLYSLPINGFAPHSNEYESIRTYENSAGAIRSSICHKNIGGTDYLFFTSNGGYLWCYTIDSTGALHYYWSENIEPSTSTPVVSANNRLYVGTNVGIDQGSIYCFTNITNESPTLADSNDSVGVVKASPIVYSDGAVDYIYYTTNMSSGAGYCMSYSGTGELTEVWHTEGCASGPDAYPLQGMACSDSGYLVFGNDLSDIIIIEP